MVGSVRHPLAGFGALLADLLPRGVGGARELALDSFESLLGSTPPSKTRLRRGVVAGRLLMKEDVGAVWPRVSQLMVLRPSAAHALFHDLAVTIDLSGLSEGELTELYRFLFVDQPVTALDGRDDATQIARSDFRDLPLAALQGRGTEAA